MYCRRCGKEIAADAAFCPYCGARQEDEPQQASSVPPYNGGSSVPPYTGQGSSVPPYSGQTQSQYLAGGYRAVPAEPEKPINNLGIAGMIVGLVSLWLSWVLFLGLVASIVAIAISGVALSRRNSYRMNGFAVAGLVLGLVALLPSILYVVIFIVASLAVTGGGMVL